MFSLSNDLYFEHYFTKDSMDFWLFRVVRQGFRKLPAYSGGSGEEAQATPSKGDQSSRSFSYMTLFFL